MIGLFTLIICLLTPVSVEARAQRPGQIPNGGTFSCANCHVNSGGGGARNAFGQAIEAGFLNGSGAGASVNWNATIAGMDSDGDGVTNGTELGDPDGDGNPSAGVTVTNPGDASSFVQVVLNRAPVFTSIGAQTALEGEVVSFGVAGSDPDNDALTFSASNLPEGAAFEDDTFTWIPGFDLGGNSVVVTFTVSDSFEEVITTVDISVTDVNRSTVVNAFDPPRARVIGMEGDGLTFSLDAEDPDGDVLTYLWTVSGSEDAEPTNSITITVPSGLQDEVVSVVATSLDGSQATQSWTIGKMLIGDFDASGDVGFTDFLAFSAQFGKTLAADVDFDTGFDLDGDGAVGFTDFLQFVENFGLSG
jgi:hypothetical protein